MVRSTLSRADRAALKRQCPELNELLTKVKGVLHVTYGISAVGAAADDEVPDYDDDKSMSRRVCEAIRVTINDADDLVRCVDELAIQPGADSAVQFVRLRQELRKSKTALLDAGKQLSTLDCRKLSEEDEKLATETAADVTAVYAEVFRVLTGGMKLPKMDSGFVPNPSTDGFIMQGGISTRRRESVTPAQSKVLMEIFHEFETQNALLDEASKGLATLHQQALQIGDELAKSHAVLDSTQAAVTSSQAQAETVIGAVSRAEKQARTRPWPVYFCCLSIFTVLAIFFLRMLLQ